MIATIIFTLSDALWLGVGFAAVYLALRLSIRIEREQAERDERRKANLPRNPNREKVGW